jgi:hemerythrin-like domain-containing protein
MAKDAIELLIEDHDRLKSLFKKLEDVPETEEAEREQLLAKIEKEIQVHTDLEEQIFYPAFQKASEDHDDEMMILEAKEEHDVADMELPRVKRTDSGTIQFEARAKVLRELITHHLEEEEKEMFPRAKKLLSDEQLEELGQEMEKRRSQLQG